MIELMNKHKKGFMGTVIIFFCSILMLVFGLGGGMGGSGSNPRTKVVAKVDGSEITAFEVDRAKRNIASGRMGRFLSPEAIEQQALDSVIAKAALNGFTKDLGITVSPQAIQGEMAKIPAIAEKGLSKESVENFITSNGISASLLEANLKDAAVFKQLNGLLTDLNIVSDLEAKKIFQSNQREAEFSYIKLDSKDFETKVNIDDQKAVSAFFEENKENYKKGTSIKYDFVKFLPQEFKDKVEITDEDVQLEYSSMKQAGRFKVPPQVKIQQIVFNKKAGSTDESANDAIKKKAEDALKRLDAKEDFSALAKELSEDSKTKGSGGERGFMAYDSLGPQLKTAALSLKNGDVSKVVNAQDGFYIIKILDTQKERTQELGEVKAVVEDKIRNDLSVEYAFAAASDAQESWKTSSGKSLDQLLKSSPELSKLKAHSASKLLEKSEMALNGVAGLSEAVLGLNKGDMSLVEAGPNEDSKIPVIAHIKEKKDSYLPELAEVKEKVITDYKQERKLELAKEKADALLKTAKEIAAQAGTGVIAQLSKSENITLSKTEKASKSAAKGEIFNMLDSKNKLFSLRKDKPFLSEVINAGDKFYLAELKSEGLNKENDFSTEKKNIVSQQKNIAGYRIFEALTETLKAKKEIWIEPKTTKESVDL